MMQRLMTCGLGLLLASGLQACCFHSDTGSGNGIATAASDAIPAGMLEIVGWGPHETKAGDPFNAQRNGQAAIWVQVDQPLNGWIAQVQFSDAVIEAKASGHLVTATVPKALYAKPGAYEIRVVARKANVSRLSNKVLFTVR